MQEITRLVDLRARRARHPEAVSALQELSADLTELRAIYRDLEDTAGRVDLADYLQQLASRVRAVFDPDGRHDLAFELAAVSVAQARASAVGRVLTELLTHAYLHAFPDDAPGRIGLGLRRAYPGALEMVVADNGVGRGTSDTTEPPDLGPTVVEHLARALDGTFDVVRRRGLIARLTFPELSEDPVG